MSKFDSDVGAWPPEMRGPDLVVGDAPPAPPPVEAPPDATHEPPSATVDPPAPPAPDPQPETVVEPLPDVTHLPPAVGVDPPTEPAPPPFPVDAHGQPIPMVLKHDATHDDGQDAQVEAPAEEVPAPILQEAPTTAEA